MSSYIQNYGFTKTLIKDNNHILQNKIIKWNGDYDGNIANINIGINNNNKEKFVNIQLTNDELKDILGIQPVEIPLEKRLSHKFLHKPIILEGIGTGTGKFMKNKSIKKKRHKKRKTRKSYFILK
jgi:hypothetical protein